MRLVAFEHVSKRYQLGLSRASLPSLVSAWTRRILAGKQRASSEQKYLWALRDVSFDLNRGDSLALVGPNGAGKTTILKLLANITKPSEGRVEVNGRLSALIELGAGFHPDLTGRDNVFLNGAILGMGRAELGRRFDEIVDFSGVERFIDTPVKRYSSGMIVRLGFAVAACIDPEVLLVDEVLAVGDAAFNQKCLARIKTLIQGGTAIIFVSHNLYLARAVCRTALYMRQGRVQLADGTESVIRAYERDLHRDQAERFERSPIGTHEVASELEITSVEVTEADGLAAPTLSSSRPARLTLRYVAYKDVGRAHASVFVRRSDGLLCFMLRTSLNGFVMAIHRGSGSITVDMPRLGLTTGTYFAEAFFLNDSDSLGTTGGRQSEWFTVTGSALNYEGNGGVFEPMAAWSHQPEAGQER